MLLTFFELFHLFHIRHLVEFLILIKQNVFSPAMYEIEIYLKSIYLYIV